MFHDVRFPEEISYGSKGGPKFSTSIITLASGKERRNQNWLDVRAEYDVAHGIKDRTDMEELRAFFYARRGRAHSFRFKDWSDYEVLAQTLGTGDGVKTDFQIIKTYVSGTDYYIRNVTKPVEGTLTNLLVNGVTQIEGPDDMSDDFSVDYSTGIISFYTPPTDGHSIVLTSCEFDVHTRFDSDHFDPVHEFWQTESWSSIMLVEIKDSF